MTRLYLIAGLLILLVGAGAYIKHSIYQQGIRDAAAKEQAAAMERTQLANRTLEASVTAGNRQAAVSGARIGELEAALEAAESAPEPVREDMTCDSDKADTPAPAPRQECSLRSWLRQP